MSATPDPVVMPEHCALLAVDVIGSGRNLPEHLPSIPELVGDLTQAALRAVGLGSDSAWDDQFTGDGFLRVYPSRFLPALVDMVGVLDELLATHNRFSKPEIRLRIVVHVGPVPAARGLYRPNIDVSRLVGAGAFKQVVGHCREHITAGAFTTALILSDTAYQTVFQGDYTRVITRDGFARLPISNNEFHERSWVRVAGVHPTQISGIPLTDQPAGVSPGESERSPDVSSGERSVDASGSVQGNQVIGDGNTVTATPHLHVNNHASGGNIVVQTGTLHGNVNHREQGKYDVDAGQAQGVQIGDGNTQHVDVRRAGVDMRAEVCDYGRAYQALGDQHISER